MYTDFYLPLLVGVILGAGLGFAGLHAAYQQGRRHGILALHTAQCQRAQQQNAAALDELAAAIMTSAQEQHEAECLAAEFTTTTPMDSPPDFLGYQTLSAQRIFERRNRGERQ